MAPAIKNKDATGDIWNVVNLGIEFAHSNTTDEATGFSQHEEICGIQLVSGNRILFVAYRPSDYLAESKQLIPISWLAFLAPDHVEPLLEHGSVVIERKTAIENFDNNAPFLTDITSGTLDFSLSERIIARVRSSRSRTLAIGIEALISRDICAAGAPAIKMLIDAIARKDAGLSYNRPSCKMINQNLYPKAGSMMPLATLLNGITIITATFVNSGGSNAAVHLVSFLPTETALSPQQGSFRFSELIGWNILISILYAL